MNVHVNLANHERNFRTFPEEFKMIFSHHKGNFQWIFNLLLMPHEFLGKCSKFASTTVIFSLKKETFSHRRKVFREIKMFRLFSERHSADPWDGKCFPISRFILSVHIITATNEKFHKTEKAPFWESTHIMIVVESGKNLSLLSSQKKLHVLKLD